MVEHHQFADVSPGVVDELLDRQAGHADAVVPCCSEPISTSTFPVTGRNARRSAWNTGTTRQHLNATSQPPPLAPLSTGHSPHPGWAIAWASMPSLASSARCSFCGAAFWRSQWSHRRSDCRANCRDSGTRHPFVAGSPYTAWLIIHFASTHWLLAPHTAPLSACSTTSSTACWPSCTPQRAPPSAITTPAAPLWTLWKRRQASAAAAHRTWVWLHRCNTCAAAHTDLCKAWVGWSSKRRGGVCAVSPSRVSFLGSWRRTSPRAVHPWHMLPSAGP